MNWENVVTLAAAAIAAVAGGVGAIAAWVTVKQASEARREAEADRRQVRADRLDDQRFAEFERQRRERDDAIYRLGAIGDLVEELSSKSEQLANHIAILPGTLQGARDKLRRALLNQPVPLPRCKAMTDVQNNIYHDIAADEARGEIHKALESLRRAGEAPSTS